MKMEMKMKNRPEKNQLMHQVYFQLDENHVSLVNLKLYLIQVENIDLSASERMSDVGS